MTYGTENNLVLCLEPEAASVHCKKLPLEGFIAENCGESKLDQSPGTRYIVVDCGGKTFSVVSVLNEDRHFIRIKSMV